PRGYPNAELFADAKDPAHGTVYFQPERSLEGRTLIVTVTYEGGKADRAKVVAGRVDTRLSMPPILLPKLSALALKAEWLGQNQGQAKAPSDVHVALSEIPPGRSI